MSGPFHRLLIARTVSIFGTAISPVALAFAMLAQPGFTPTQLGLVVGSQAVAEAIVPLLGGALADRFSRSRLMVICDATAAVAVGATALLFATRTVNIGALMALATVAGIASALFFPALAGLVPEIVPSDRLQSANGMLRLGANAARIGGPIVGGLIVTAASPVWGLAANATSFAISAVLVAGLSTRKLTPGPSLLTDLRGGWQEFASRSWLWSVVLAGAVMNLAFNAGLVVLGPVIARAEYGGARAWSIVLTALAIGMVAGTLLAMRIRARRPLVVVALAFVPLSLPFALLAGHAKLPVVVVAAIIAGISLDVISVLWDTTLQRRVPMDAIGRVTSYDMVGSFALAPLGLILAGPAAATIGVSASLVGCAVLIAGAGLAALLVPAVRYLHQPAG